MGEPLVAGAIGILGILVGALLQHWFNRRLFQEARYLELKSEAVLGYRAGVGGST
jgi:xanthosine utilization system XapX-like protein